VTDPHSWTIRPANYLAAKAGTVTGIPPQPTPAVAGRSQTVSFGSARGERCDDADHLRFERIAVTREPPLFERRPSRAARRHPGIALQGFGALRPASYRAYASNVALRASSSTKMHQITFSERID